MIVGRYLDHVVVGLAPEDVGKLMCGQPLFIPSIRPDKEKSVILFFGHSAKQLRDLVDKEGIK